MASRKGSLLEKNLEQLFKLTGFNPELNKFYKGYEIDVFLRIENKYVGIECKQYENSNLSVRNIIHQWDSKNKELNLDKIILVFIGVNISKSDYVLAEKYNIIIWDDHKLSRLINQAIEKKEQFRENLLREMKIIDENEAIHKEDKIETDYKFQANIIQKLKNPIEKNNSETPKSETTALVYPYSLFIEGADSFQIQFAAKGGIRIFFTFPTAQGIRLFASILDEFKIEATKRNNPITGEYTISSVGIIVSFGEDLELASQVITKSLITMYNFDENRQLKFKYVGGGVCFIATASYGTPFAEEINILRFWRDNFLLKNYFGTQFVKTYYLLSPPIARFIQKRDYLRTSVRFCLNPFIKLLKKIYKK